MKKLILLFLMTGFLMTGFRVQKNFAQVGAAINTTGNSADHSAILDVSSSTQGILIPRMTESQKSAISSPANGLMIYQTDGIQGFWYFNGSIWVQAIGPTGLTGPAGLPGPAGPVGCSTANSVIKSDGTSAVCSQITDNGSFVGINNTNPMNSLDINGSVANAITTVSSSSVLDQTMSTVIANPVTAYNLTLPSLAASVHRVYTIIYGATPVTNAITISGDANIIKGGQSMSAYTFTGGSITLQNDGSSWQMVSCTPCFAAPGPPASISGSSYVFANSTGVVYSVTPVPNATYYTWAVPAGAVITSGQGSSSITVNMGSTSGNISVAASNSCGISSAASMAVSICTSAVISLDATAFVKPTSSVTSSTFTINTSTDNEIILVGVNFYTFSTAPVVTVDAYPVTEIAGVYGGAMIKMYACVATSAGSHTITVTWPTGVFNTPTIDLAYAAAFKGFCGIPSVSGNIQCVSATGTTSVSASITPAVANSCLFGDFYNFTGGAATGNVSWTNATKIRSDYSYDFNCDGSIANKQLTGTSAVTVTATDQAASSGGAVAGMILLVVHP